MKGKKYRHLVALRVNNKLVLTMRNYWKFLEETVILKIKHYPTRECASYRLCKGINEKRKTESISPNN